MHASLSDALSNDPLLTLRSGGDALATHAGGAAPSLRAPLLWALAGCALFGAALGSYAGPRYAFAAALKMPLLLFGTGALCFPAFHALQALGKRRALDLETAAALQLGALAATALVWGTLAPPLFLLVGTVKHYALAKALAVAVGAAGGVVGLRRLVRDYRALTSDAPDTSWLRLPPAPIAAYLALFATTGTQLAWVLRPFVGAPSAPFAWFRPISSNFFAHLLGL